MLKLRIFNICRWYSVGVVAFVMVCGWNIAVISSHPITTTYDLIAKNFQMNKLPTSLSYENNIQSIHSTQSSSTKANITNQPSTTHFIKYENVIYKLTLSTDGKQQRWIYVTPLHNHYHNNETKGNDVSGHTRRTGNKRTLMKVSNATIPITLLSTVHHTNNLFKNFNHNNHKVNNINNNDGNDDTTNGNISTKSLKWQRNVQCGNRKLDVEKLGHVEPLEKATIVKNFKQSNESDKFNNIGKYQGKSFIVPLRKDPFYKNDFVNDGVVNESRLPPLTKNEFLQTAPHDNDLPSYQRYGIQPITTVILPFRHVQSNKFTQNEYYRVMNERHRKFILSSKPFYSGNEVNGKYRIWDGHNKSFDPVVLQLMFTHHESILPQPHFWGIRGYGLYSCAAGNDLHNNLPNSGNKVERDFNH